MMMIVTQDSLRPQALNAPSCRRPSRFRETDLTHRDRRSAHILGTHRPSPVPPLRLSREHQARAQQAAAREGMAA